MSTKSQEALAAVLTTLRRRARLSQRDLARRAGVSATAIGDLERAVGYNASPLMLRAISRGLASFERDADGAEVTEVDQLRADAFYRQLMDAAGYLGGLPIGISQPEAQTEEDAEHAALKFLSSKAGDADLAARLVGLARRYAELSPEDQIAVRHLVGMWVKDD